MRIVMFGLLGTDIDVNISGCLLDQKTSAVTCQKLWPYSLHSTKDNYTTYIVGTCFRLDSGNR